MRAPEIKGRVWLLVAIVICLVGSCLVSLRIATVREISRIEALEGHTGDLAELTKMIRTRHTRPESPQELERGQTAMGLDTLSNLTVVRFDGEGFPYFCGWVAYDTNQHRVVRAVVVALW